MAEVIRLDDALVQFRGEKKSLQAVFRIHCTYFQAQWSGLTDAAATRFPDFSNLMRKQTSAGYRRLNKALMIRTRKTGEASISDIPSSLFPSLEVEKKVTADKRSGTNRSLPYK